MSSLTDQIMILPLATLIYYLMILLFLVLVLMIAISFYQKKKAQKKLSLLKPIFIKLLQENTGEVATNIQVSNPVGDLMDMDVPMYMIEKIRRENLKITDRKYQLWMSILVCCAYEEDKGIKDEMVQLIKKDMESAGSHEDAGLLAPLCKYIISPFNLFKIIICLINEKMPDSILNSSFKEINGFVETYKISSDVKAVKRFELVTKSIPYIAVAVVGFIISWLMNCYNDMLPDYLYWITIMIMVIVVVAISGILWWIIGQPAKHHSCEEIEEGILADIPDLF